MEFPPLDEIAAMASSEYERDFLRAEFGPGLPYHLRRLEQIRFDGNRVLDAGAGAGQWSIALSQRFARVDALDLKADRLEILSRTAKTMGISNITTRLGSVESLPFDDQSFDAVFCYGVIMFTRVATTLAEFHRVLRPGGRVYVCLNGDGWSHYLIQERGKKNPNVIPIGQMTLYKTAWHRARQRGFGPAIWSADAEALRRQEKAASLWEGPGRRKRIFASVCRRFFPALAFDNEFRSELGRQLYSEVVADCGEGFRTRLLSDMRAAVAGQDVLSDLGVDRAYRPEEFCELTKEVGFTDFQWAHEAGLLCEWVSAPAAPKYEGYFDRKIAVWECLLTRPQPIACDAETVEMHLSDARMAESRPVYVESSPNPVISNMDLSTFPLSLLAQAQERAGRFGGQRYLQELARFVAGDSSAEEKRFRRILSFVQSALYRDPVAQPVNANGTLPDAATILFSSRGRCGHCVRLVTEMCRAVDLEAETHQLPKHVTARVKVDHRWIVADADAFKHGIVLTNRNGKLLSYDDLLENPYLIDRFPTTGWFYRPGTRHTAGFFGHQVIGYVDALEPEIRGYVSGYYAPAVQGTPPTVVREVRLDVRGGRFFLRWQPAHCKTDRLMHYRVQVATKSRGWTYSDLTHPTAAAESLPADMLRSETVETSAEGDVPAGAAAIFASVTAVSSRIEREPDTYFWPSEEVRREL